MKTKTPIPQLFSWSALAVVSLLASNWTAHADYKNTVIADNPFAFYPLNLDVDTSGTATDVSGNGNNGAYVNIFSGYNNAIGPSAYITNAVLFNGIDTSVDLSAASALTSFSGLATLEAWVQPADSTSFGDIIAKGYDSSSYLETYIRVDGPYGANYDANLGTAQLTGGQQATNWTHVVLANDGANTTLYVNGIAVQSKPDTAGAISFTDPWAIGNGTSAGNGRHFNGNITQVAIYGHGLTSAQVLNHYYMGLLGTPAATSVPIINVQPQSQPSYVGGTVTFSVTAVSALPMTNQWYYGSNPMPGRTNATLTLTNLQLANAGNYRVVVGNANGTTNSAVAVLTVSTPRNLVWSANANTGNWDNSSANWINTANSQATAFSPGDAVLFDDTPGVPTSVVVNDTVVPSVVNVNASANTYTFNGPNRLSGFGSFIKNGSSTLTILTPSGYAGSVAINGGVVYAGNNCFRTVSAIAVTNDATLDVGGGGFNNLTPITISGAGFGGQGALINSYNDYPSEFVNLIMTGDTLLGGSARWDMATGSQVNGAHHLTVDLGNGAGYTEWNSVTVGSSVLGITVTNGNFGSKGLDTAFQNPATVLTMSPNTELTFWSGGWNGSLHIMSGTTVNMWTAPAAFNGSSITLEDNAQWRSWSGGSDEPVNSAIVLNGVAHCILGDHNLIYTNLVSGPGGILLDYWNHAYVFSSSNTYTGPTIINDGPQVKLTGNGSILHSPLIFFGGGNSNSVHLDASSRSDSTLTLASGQTLGGIGAVAGNLVESAGATIAPAGTNTTINITTGANPTGTIAASGNIAFHGNTVIKLNGSGTNDAVVAGGTLSYGGILSLENISGTPLAAGNTFQIFQASGGISGSFASITPATPGAGLTWNTSQLSSGVLSVSSPTGPSFTNVVVSGGGIIVSGSGGTPGGTFYVLAATNVLSPLTNWVVWSTNSYDSNGNFRVTNAITAGVPQRYYRIRQ
jgi:autotransporter-associated beta strand protein